MFNFNVHSANKELQFLSLIHKRFNFFKAMKSYYKKKTSVILYRMLVPTNFLELRNDIKLKNWKICH